MIRDPAPNLIFQAALIEKVTEQLEEEQAVIAPPAAAAEGVQEPMALTVAGVVGDELTADTLLAVKRVKLLCEKNPSIIDKDILCELLIRKKCKQGAIVGICAAGPAMILPGWGSLASIVLGGVADVTLTTKLEVDLALEIMFLYQGEKSCLDPVERKSFLLKVSGLEGLNQDEDHDENATREAGERLAVRASEEVGKRSLLKFIPVVGATVNAGTNVVGIYVIGKRSQTLAKGFSLNESWRESVNRYVLPKEFSTILSQQLSHVPSAITTTLAETYTNIGKRAKKLLSNLKTED